MTNSCGACKHFIKATNSRLAGLCDLNDIKTKSDSDGKSCKGFKRIKLHPVVKELIE